MMSDSSEMPARARTNSFRPRPFAPLSPQEARRQGAISTLAFRLLGGRDPALAFLNGECAELLGRPLAIATLSDAGYAIVERAIRSRAMIVGRRHAD